MKEKQQIVYLKADRNSVCHDPKIKIQDVMSVQCADPAICAGIKNKTLYTFQKNDGTKKEGKKKKRMEVFYAEGHRTDTDRLSGGRSGQHWRTGFCSAIVRRTNGT